MTSITVDETTALTQGKPGAQLAALRLQKGYTQEYIAGKLHLRLQIIEQLEADEYVNMPQPVFIKGYLRAYAKLLGVAADPFLESFNRYDISEPKIERALWQSRREVNKAEHAIRWVTGLFALVVIIAVALWWYKNSDNERILPATVSQADVSEKKPEAEIRLTDLSKMRSILAPTNQPMDAEKTGG